MCNEKTVVYAERTAPVTVSASGVKASHESLLSSSSHSVVYLHRCGQMLPVAQTATTSSQHSLGSPRGAGSMLFGDSKDVLGARRCPSLLGLPPGVSAVHQSASFGANTQPLIASLSWLFIYLFILYFIFILIQYLFCS